MKTHVSLGILVCSDNTTTQFPSLAEFRAGGEDAGPEFSQRCALGESRGRQRHLINL